MSQAHFFNRVRQDHSQETAEDYSNIIYQLGNDSYVLQKDIAQMVGVSHVTVVRAITRLERDGYVERARGRGVRLTARGIALAKASQERYGLVVEFLRWLGVSPDTAASDAEGIEHHVSEETIERMRAVMQEDGRTRGTD